MVLATHEYCSGLCYEIQFQVTSATSVYQKRRAIYVSVAFNTLRPNQNGRHIADDIFKCIFLNENVWIPNNISLKFVPKGPINNIPALVQIMPWHRPGDKPSSEPTMVSLPTQICVTRPQWVNNDTEMSCRVTVVKCYLFYFISLSHVIYLDISGWMRKRPGCQ